MYRIFIFFIQLILFLTILSFIFNNPFTISLDIGNLKYAFSSNLFAILLIIFLLIFYFSFYLIFRSRFLIHNYFLKINLKD